MNLILTQCFPPTIGGIENVMGGLANGLAARGERVLVLADGSAAACAAFDSAARFEVRRFGGVKFWRRRYKAWAAARVLRAGGVQRVFCDSWKSLELLPRVAAKVPIYVWAHGSEFPLSPSARKQARIGKTLARAQRILVNSQTTWQRAQACGVDMNVPLTIAGGVGAYEHAPRLGGAQAVMWHPPVEAAVMPNEAATQQAAAVWRDGAPRLLTVARLVERKGIDTMVAAVAQLIKEYPQLRYVVAGAGAQEAALRAMISQHGLEGAVQLIGRVDDEMKAALYASADVFTLPARAVGDDIEGFGIVFLEAGLWGLPSVAGVCGGVSEAVADEKTGLHCNGESVESARAAVARLLADDSLRQQLGAAAKANAQANLWSARVGELLSDIIAP